MSRPLARAPRPRGGRILGERTRPPLRPHQPAGAEPPPLLLLGELLLAVIAEPEGLTTYQRLPLSLSAWPLIWPGLVSPTNGTAGVRRRSPGCQTRASRCR